MTSTVKVNNVQASDGGNIINQCGTTITIGASGDTVALASGASQSGFGRAGSVDWQTSSIKTSTFTAVSGEGYFANTTGGEFTVNLPAGSAGAIVAVSDYTRTFGTNKLTITPNGSEKIGGVAASIFLNVNGQALTLVYVDATEGWINVQNAEDTEEGTLPAFITATGGTITTVCTNYKVHTFTGPGTFTVCSVGNVAGSNEVSYVVVGGGAGTGSRWHAGGGGAGGYREGKTSQCNTWTASPLATTGLPVSAQGYPIVVGAGGSDGGAPGNNPAPGGGNNSSFSTITSAGGGKGGTFNESGGNGGSGGGGGSAPGSPQPGGTGNTPPVSPPQGTNGGSGAYPSGGGSGGGGGGATQAGSPSPNTSTAGDGGMVQLLQLMELQQQELVEDQVLNLHVVQQVQVVQVVEQILVQVEQQILVAAEVVHRLHKVLKHLDQVVDLV